MDKNTVPVMDEIQALKRENMFLRFRNDRYKRQLASIRARYKVIETPHLNGVVVYDNDDVELEGIFHMNLSEIADGIGVKSSELTNVLIEKDIIAKAGHITYLCHPVEHSRLVLYKRLKLERFERLNLYWTKEGVKFVIRLAVENGVQPRKFLNLQ